MARILLNLDSLKSLDAGAVREAFDMHLKRASLDCYDRPADPKARTVALEIAIVPVLDPNGQCERTEFQIHLSSKVPKHRTRVHQASLQHNGSMIFDELSIDNADQSSLNLGDED